MGNPDKFNKFDDNLNKKFTPLEMKLIDYFDVLNSCNYPNYYMEFSKNELSEIDKLKKELNLMTEKLSKKSCDIYKRGIVLEIMEDIRKMPVCCIEIIFEYCDEHVSHHNEKIWCINKKNLYTLHYTI